MKITKKTFSSSWASIPFKGVVYTSFGLSLLTGLLIIIFSPYLPPTLPLFYGKPIGEGQLVPVVYFWAAPAVSMLINAINIFLALITDDFFIRKILVSAAFFITVLTAITAVRIIFLVGLF